MANVAVIKSIEESYELIRAHWREVLVPLAILLLISGAGNMGGRSFSSGSKGSSSYSGLSSSAEPGVLVANALAGADASLLTGIVLLALILLAIVFFVVFAILGRAIWFYVYEHFHCILLGKKAPDDWQARFKRHAKKSAVLFLFNASLLVLFVAIPVVIALAMPGFIPSGGFSLPTLAPIILLFLLFLALFLAAEFFLSTLWIYYAMDLVPFDESVRRSVSLVSGNIPTFLKFVGIFLLIGIAAAVAIIATCCFAFVTAPVVQVFVALLSGVSLMNIKLKLEGKANLVAAALSKAEKLSPKKPAKKK